MLFVYFYVFIIKPSKMKNEKQLREEYEKQRQELKDEIQEIIDRLTLQDRKLELLCDKLGVNYTVKNIYDDNNNLISSYKIKK